MRALVVLAACLAVSPVFALGHMGMAMRPGGFGHAPAHGGHGGLGFLNGALGPVISPPLPEPQAAPDAAEPYVNLAPAPRCAPVQPVVTTIVGPKIIYINHKPTISGPKVIYGTD